ncbi:hypothetical protein Tco_0428161 [Tanacetum coccineum]
MLDIRVCYRSRPGCSELFLQEERCSLNYIQEWRARVFEGLSDMVEDLTMSDADQMWNTLACTMRDVTKDALGVASGLATTKTTCRESWWFSEEVQKEVAVKQARFRVLLMCREGQQEDRAITE